MGLKVVADVVAENSAKATCTGADDLLAKFGLSRLYGPATTAPPSNPYLKLKQAGDRRLFKSDRWLLASVVDWPDHQFHWRDYSQTELRRAFPLAPGAFDIQEEERGVLVAGQSSGPAAYTPSASEGLSEATGRIKIKIKKRQRAGSQEPAAAAAAAAADQAGPPAPLPAPRASKKSKS